MDTETFTFVPHPLLFHPHLMTLVPRQWTRPGLLHNVPQENRLFRVDSESHILAKCHWHQDRKKHQALLIVHGLEGCTESHYMRGIAHKAWHAGFNVIRMNQRNCGGTEHLTPTLYNNGLSEDIKAVVREIADRDGISAIWLAGYSMGGNLILRLAGQAQETLPILKGVIAICPNIHPAACVAALEQSSNWIYHQYFLHSFKARLRRKSRYYPGKFNLTLFPSVRTLTQFDDAFTAPCGGFRDAADYYEQTGAKNVLHQIRIPTLIITAQDDPFIPFSTINIPQLHSNPWIQMVAPLQGGHCGFLQKPRKHEDGFWAENRIVEFIQKTGQTFGGS